MKKETLKNAIIIANGKIQDHARIREHIIPQYGKDTMIISADGGLENTIRLSLVPDVVIGDMDSLDLDKYGDRLSDPEIIRVSGDKDESDTRLAVEYALGSGIRNIMITGASGGRLDHTFANIMLLASPGLEETRVRMITEDSEVFVMKKSGTIKGRRGKLVSLFSLTPYTSFIRTRGLKYPLMDERLAQSPVRGLSNVFTEDEAMLEFSDGKILIIREL